MFCPNCGNKLNGNEDFCSSCGTRIVKTENTRTLTEQFSNTSSNFFKPIINKIKNFVVKYKKPLIIGASCCFIIILGIILFNTFYDFTKINWVEDYGDYNVTHTAPTTLKLNVEAYDKEKNPIYDIEFSVNSGEVITNGNNVEWKLPNESGTFTITAKAPSGKKITKDVDVIVLEEDLPLAGFVTSEYDEMDDNDNDGLTNAEEKELGTNPNVMDTDKDGLSDKYEIDESKTDPLKKDTDGDGLNDGDELDLGLNPLKIDSKNDGINDGNREVSITISDETKGISLAIKGKGNIASTTIDVLENSTLSDVDGLLDKVYNFYSNGTINSAEVKIKYTLDEINIAGLNEDDLTLYYFNDETKGLEEINTIVDKENKEIIVTLEHFSKYVIGDKNIVVTNKQTNIMFVIDNSVSMYTYDQLENAGFYDITGADGNDKDFKRLSLTNKMIDMFTGNYNFGVSEFAGTYTNLKDFTNDKSSVKDAVNSMNTNFHVNTTGTNIITALKSSIQEFGQDDSNHYLILLTDGKNTSGSLSSNKETIINKAKEKNVKICVIGLGLEVDADDLNNIAEETGCDYYSASNASALDEIYSIMGADINYNMVDTDGDGKTDGTIIADSGFITTRDGFSFGNFSSNKTDGHCYGMATFAMLHYTNKLPTYLPYAHKYILLFKPFESADGYDLSNTYFTSGKNLYDYKTSTKALTRYLYDKPSDYRDRIEDKIFKIKKEYYDDLISIGATIRIKKWDNNEDFNKYESALLNINNETFNNAVTNDEKQLLNAIWRLFVLQVQDKRTSFSDAPDKAFEELITELKQGNPVVLGINGNHAINAVRLIQDNSNANKFKLEVYDNNNPGETKYVEFERSKFNKIQLNFTAWNNEYNYSFKYDIDYDGDIEDATLLISYPVVN